MLVRAWDTCYVHRVHDEATGLEPFKPLRTVAAFAVLMFGSALGLAWFHSDVDMPRAMEHAVYAAYGELSAGRQPLDHHSLYGRRCAGRVRVLRDSRAKNAVTPLEVKLTEYQGDMEQTEGQRHPWGSDMRALQGRC